MEGDRVGDTFLFSRENFIDPKLPHGLNVVEVPLVLASDENLLGLGKIISSLDEHTIAKKNFEIVKWPVKGWRHLDPETGDEGGTTEGSFDVDWVGDYYYGKNLAITSSSNTYLDGLGAIPENASRHDAYATSTSSSDDDGAALAKRHDNCIYLWMSDYHPDGAQLFWPVTPIPFVVCLGPSSVGDDIKPSDMKAFYIPPGKGVYLHPSTWHNGVYVSKEYTPCRFITRQGKVHARVSASWAAEFKCLLKVPLELTKS